MSKYDASTACGARGMKLFENLVGGDNDLFILAKNITINRRKTQNLGGISFGLGLPSILKFWTTDGYPNGQCALVTFDFKFDKIFQDAKPCTYQYLSFCEDWGLRSSL
jgi:hypothetical protein